MDQNKDGKLDLWFGKAVRVLVRYCIKVVPAYYVNNLEGDSCRRLKSQEIRSLNLGEFPGGLEGLAS